MHLYALAALREIGAGRAIVVVDLEATGLLRAGEPLPYIWEIGAIRRAPGGQTERFASLVRLTGPIPTAANLRGIDPTLPARLGSPIGDVLEAFSSFAEGATWVGHRIDSYDCVLLRAAYEATHLSLPEPLARPQLTIDTQFLAQALYAWEPEPGPRPAGFGLAALGRFFGIPFDAEALHEAMVDVELNLAIFDALLSEAATRRSRHVA